MGEILVRKFIDFDTDLFILIFFTSSRTRQLSACFTTECGNPGILKSMSTSFNIERSWFASRQTTGFTVLSCFVSSFTLKFVLSWEKRVWDAPCSWHMSRQTTGFSVLSWSGLGFGCLDWELLDCWTTSSSGCRAISEPNSFIQSCVKEIFGGGRGDAYTYSFLTSPVSILTTFGIQ